MTYSTASTTVNDTRAYWGPLNRTPDFYVGGQGYPIQGTHPDITATREDPMKITPKSHLVIARASGAVVEVHDSKEEALAAAKRLAAKEQDEYWVFSPTVTVRPKPVDLEVIE